MYKSALLIVLLLLVSSVQSAPNGQLLYEQHCSGCHRYLGEGGIGLQLNGSKMRRLTDEYLVKSATKKLSSLMSGPYVAFLADVLLEDGQIISVGELEFKVIHTPGHTPGGISVKTEDVIFTGDTLFASSIGRTDFEGGSFDDIISSIKNKLLVYDDDVKVLPGHGPASTIGMERAKNPFLR